jgi:quinol monooxygenase YgiN
MSTGSSDDISPRVIAAVGHDAPFALLVLMDLPTEDASVIAKLKEVSKIAADGTAKEEGCKLYSFYQDIDLPQRYFLAEKWQNVAALIKHLSTPHVAPLLAFLSEEKVATNIRVLAHIATPLVRFLQKTILPLYHAFI